MTVGSAPSGRWLRMSVRQWTMTMRMRLIRDLVASETDQGR